MKFANNKLIQMNKNTITKFIQKRSEYKVKDTTCLCNKFK